MRRAEGASSGSQPRAQDAAPRAGQVRPPAGAGPEPLRGGQLRGRVRDQDAHEPGAAVHAGLSHRRRAELRQDPVQDVPEPTGHRRQARGSGWVSRCREAGHGWEERREDAGH